MLNRPVLKRDCTSRLIVRFLFEIHAYNILRDQYDSYFFLVYQDSILVPNPSFCPFVMFNRPVLKRDCTFELIVRFQCEIHVDLVHRDQYDSCIFCLSNLAFGFSSQFHPFCDIQQTCTET